jgi:hypothetical protein
LPLPLCRTNSGYAILVRRALCGKVVGQGNRHRVAAHEARRLAA